MKKFLVLLGVLSFLPLLFSVNARAGDSSSPRGMPMYVENVGQFHPEVRFRVYGNQACAWVTDNALWFSVLERTGPVDMMGDQKKAVPGKGAHVKLTFAGGNTRPDIEPFNRLDTHFSYFIGDQSRWRSDVPVWAGVRLKEVYPGIDVELSGSCGQLAMRAIARTRADLNRVCLAVDGAEEMSIQANRVQVKTAAGRLSIPLCEASGTDTGRPFISGNLVVSPFWEGNRNPGFTPFMQSIMEKPYEIAFSTYLGGIMDEAGHSIKTDKSGAVYITGDTHSLDFPITPGSFDPDYNGGDEDVFVTKLSPDGSHLIYSTYLGGKDWDCGIYMVIDQSGSAIITGGTCSIDFPTTPGAYDTTFNGGEDIFVARLNATGTQLIFSTFIGGTHVEWGNSITLGNDGSVFITGTTLSPDFPVTPGAFDRTLGGWEDAYVAKLSGSGSQLLYSTFLGGSYLDKGKRIIVDGYGAIYVAGNTQSSDFPVTAGAFDPNHNGIEDVFVCKMDPAGSCLLYSTFLGGSAIELIRGFALDEGPGISPGSVYVAGYTQSKDFPVTPGAFDTIFKGTKDGFVAKINELGSKLIYSTFISGGNDQFWDLALDKSGAAWVTGFSLGPSFPVTPDAVDPYWNGDGDGVIAKLDSSGSRLLYSTYLGGSLVDDCSGIACDQDGSICLTGYTSSTDFPCVNAYDPVYNGGNSDGFVVKLKKCKPKILVDGCQNTIPPAGAGIPYGSVVDLGMVGAGSILKKSFCIKNTGDLSLQLTGQPPVQLENNSRTFRIDTQPASVVPPGGSTSFVVSFLSASRGVFYADVVINSNDPDQSRFYFKVKGTVLAIPDLVIDDGTTTIPHEGQYNFGKIKVGQSKTVTFYIRCLTSMADVTLTGTPKVQLQLDQGGGFAVTLQPASPVKEGTPSLFKIVFTGKSATPTPGSFSGTVYIPNNNPDKNPYTFRILGTTY